MQSSSRSFAGNEGVKFVLMPPGKLGWRDRCQKHITSLSSPGLSEDRVLSRALILASVICP